MYQKYVLFFEWDSIMKEKSAILIKNSGQNMLFSIFCPLIYLSKQSFAYDLFFRIRLDYLQQLNLELQHAVRLDVLPCTTLTVCQLRRNPENVF